MHDHNNSDDSSGSGLFVRKETQIVIVDPEDTAVVRAYPDWSDKGSVVDGRRITIMAKKQCYQVNERVRIIHVLEAVIPGYEVYLMGPKAIMGEYVSGQLQGQEGVGGQSDPFKPEEYDGRVMDSPATDFNFDISEYLFTQPGVYTISWQPGKWQSNILKIEVLE
ncbi:MAG: hypothetical protein KKD63_02080 [Proteobacteria bacterium]|nr:hypothetical protein [Desulfobulbaceae bacterium]MBU4151649.1 hypothetical protein [Pseudomonadota bacterium]